MTTPRSDMDLSHLPEVESTRLLWREQLAALPRAAWCALRRLLRREARHYLSIDGRVAARFTSGQDHLEFMTWLASTHNGAFDFGFETGREYLVAQHINAAGPDASVPGT